MAKLGKEALDEALAALPAWRLAGGKMAREWEFADFAAAMDFVNHVAQAAEEAGHHPDIDIRYNKVLLGLVSHDAGGITGRDVRMAKTLDRLFPKG